FLCVELVRGHEEAAPIDGECRSYACHALRPTLWLKLLRDLTLFVVPDDDVLFVQEHDPRPRWVRRYHPERLGTLGQCRRAQNAQFVTFQIIGDQFAFEGSLTCRYRGEGRFAVESKLHVLSVGWDKHPSDEI